MVKEEKDKEKYKRNATVNLKLIAESGYTSTEVHKISPHQWGRVCEILNEGAIPEKSDMTPEKFKSIMDETDRDRSIRDNCFYGLKVIAKYYDANEETIVVHAGHDEVWSVPVEELIERNISEKDVMKLAKLGWTIQGGEYLKCYT